MVCEAEFVDGERFAVLPPLLHSIFVMHGALISAGAGTVVVSDLEVASFAPSA